MDTRQWLPRGTELADRSKVKKILAFGRQWQIMDTSCDSQVLIVLPQLLGKWAKAGIITPDIFATVNFDQMEYGVFLGKHGYIISSVANGPYPSTYIEALAFAISLRETRKLIGDVSLHDAIYIEQISKILPTYTISEMADDKTVLGTWLTGGVSISTDSFRRLSKLLEWMGSREVANIICEAGFSINNNNLSGAKTLLDEKANRHENIELNPGLVSGVKFSLPGRPYLENLFNENIIDIVVNEEKYKKMGIDFPPAIILHGPPGCGKTFAVDRLVEFMDWPGFPINSGTIGSPYVHDTSRKISSVFDKAIENAPSIIVIDEMESFLTKRDYGLQSGLHHLEEVAEFLRRIPEAAKNKVLVIAMTNMINSIDPAILRRGRFDHIIEVKMPSQKEVSILLTSLLSKVPSAKDLNIKDLSLKLEGRPLSDVAFLLREAGRLAVKHNKEEIDNVALTSAFALLPQQVEGTKNKIGFRRD
ncbi:MAG: ATP-binding protein [Desulfotomaculaceae bacterium]|nr:ATP-binding protein [Desulfotomaculaceae bacterium]